ncbi:GNAT family N-acetyltransferase [Nonomuraea candida]|uniref:GNAT family N-acetyltransferase n=1 Tax=Nonomuraea candida TaxID=359159 RepID=UPI0006948508|nr:GNAT family N-acetyltransferase [Nonomuraea candida]
MAEHAGSLGDLELLEIEMRVLWPHDDHGRLQGPEELVLAVAPEGITAAVAGTVPDDLAGHLLDLVEQAAPSSPDRPPQVLKECRTLLDQSMRGPSTVSAGPSYLASPPVRFGLAAEVLRSDNLNDAQRVRPMRPGNWEPEEWEELIGGGAGAPWSMIVDNDQVVSICHTPRRTPAGAEAGTWTAQAFRGRGYAAATTAAWVDLLSPHCPFLFYSTSADNRSSRRVAERLGLRDIGWLWKLTRGPVAG